MSIMTYIEAAASFEERSVNVELGSNCPYLWYSITVANLLEVSMATDAAILSQ